MSGFIRTRSQKGGVRFVRPHGVPAPTEESVEDLDAPQPQPKPTKLERLMSALDREYGLDPDALTELTTTDED